MAGTARILLIAATLLLVTDRLAHGQGPDQLPAPTPVAPDSAGTPLAALTPAPLPGADYFQPRVWSVPLPSFHEPDPLLEDQGAPPPGWFANLELGLVGAHVKNRLMDALPITDSRTDVVHMRGADLDLTAAPSFSLGYRVPHGFGEFLISYRFLVTEGSGLVPSDQGLAQEKSRLDVNYWDFDYANREFSLGPHWDMRWVVGVRLASVYFDGRSLVAMPTDGLGENSVEQRATSNFLGAGPHVGLDLAWRFDSCRLAIFGQVEGAYLWGHIGQNFEETLTFPGAEGAPLRAIANDSISQGVGVIGARGGLRWAPPLCHCTYLFLGYEFEAWNQVGRDDNVGSRGDFYENGLFLRGEFTF